MLQRSTIQPSSISRKGIECKTASAVCGIEGREKTLLKNNIAKRADAEGKKNCPDRVAFHFGGFFFWPTKFNSRHLVRVWESLFTDTLPLTFLHIFFSLPFNPFLFLYICSHQHLVPTLLRVCDLLILIYYSDTSFLLAF